MPESIKIIGDHTYDYGYYKGITKLKGRNRKFLERKNTSLYGENGGQDWNMILDIWNRIPSAPKI